MNTKFIIASVVGGILIFFWQFVSNTIGGIHRTNQKYTANQDAILANLSANLTENGTYYLPTVPPGTSMDDEQKAYEGSIGKPWAEIHFSKSMGMNMTMNMVRGVLADIVAVGLLVFFVFSGFQSIDMKSAILASVGAGVCMYLTTSYGNAIWYGKNSMPDLIDAVIGWFLAGAWLGWYLKRG